jgi:putative ABC transport system substrate-binding protein
MKRNEFVGLLSCAALTRPFAAFAQQPATPVIGYLSGGSPAGFAQLLAAFRQGLSEAGFVESQNVALEYRWSEGQDDRLPEFAADLVRRRVSIIVSTGGSSPATAAKAATATIPIVFTGGNDPVKLGLVKSLGRPGGNATGVLNISSELTGKRLQLLHELVPAAVTIAALFNPANEALVTEIQEAARTMGLRMLVERVNSESDLDAAFANVVRMGAGALFVGADPLFTSRRAQVVALAARHAIPASYSFREFVVAGGLMSYGANLADVHRQAGVYAGRILKGAKPAELPVMQPTKFDLVINSKTAKALRIVVPPRLLVTAEVIE